jgi:hypothetical protein
LIGWLVDLENGGPADRKISALSGSGSRAPDKSSTDTFQERSEPRPSIAVVVIVAPLALVAVHTDVICVDEVRHGPLVLKSGRPALPDDFSVGKMRYNRNAAETFYQLFTTALRNAPA